MKKVYVTSIVKSLGDVVSLKLQSKGIRNIDSPTKLSEVNVLIGTIGDIEGTIAIFGPESTFKKLSEAMYGMQVEGEMLYSFAGEFANTLAGNTATVLSNQGIKVDVSPPSILEGSSVLRSVGENSQEITFAIEDEHELKLIISSK